jgi:hypothetical protein
MRAVLRRLHSPDVDDLATYRPSEPDKFGFFLQILVGPVESDGEESFDVVVCTPLWLLERHSREDIISGRHMIIVLEYDYRRLMNFLEKRVAEAVGNDWTDVARHLSSLGRWEFEDYVPAR